MKKYAVLAALSPLVLFMVLYSLDGGCFICLYGAGSGGNLEAGINIALAAILVGALGVMIWRDIARSRKD